MESPMPPFETVREQLLRAGIAPRHVNRYVAELRDHLRDLVAQEQAADLDPRQAEARARKLLGSDEQLTAAMIASAPRSLAARAPALVFALLPTLLMVLFVLVTGLAAFKLLWPVRGVAPADMPAAYSYFIATAGFFTSYALGLLIAAGCITMAVRQRLSSGWVWVGLALIALLSGPLGFQTNLFPAEAGFDDSRRYSMLRIVYREGHPDLAATMTYSLLRDAVMFLVMALFYRGVQKRARAG
jgi:hypothetical protein